MRIGFLVDYFWPHVGGMETWTFEVSRELVRQGHKVIVYTYKTSGHLRDEKLEGIEIHRFGPSCLSSLFQNNRAYPIAARALALLIGLTRIIEDRVDFLVATYVPLLFIGPLARLLPTRVWGTFHGFYDSSEGVASKSPLRGLLSTFVEYLASRVPVIGFVVVGRLLEDTLVRRGVSKQKVRVIIGGANVPATDSIKVNKAAFPQICFMARLTRDKRLDDLIAAFLTVKKNLPDTKMIVVGDGPEGERYRDIVRSLKLGNEVLFLGALTGNPKLAALKQSHVLVHPSLQEGMSLTIFESLACYTPVIAYGIPSIIEQLTLTGGGITVRPRDTLALAKAITTLLTDKELRTELSEHGRSVVSGYFSWKVVAEKLLELARIGGDDRKAAPPST